MSGAVPTKRGGPQAALGALRRTEPLRTGRRDDQVPDDLDYQVPAGRDRSRPPAKPLPTSYSGITFRSRLEARWAIYFDAVGIDWEYEREAYDLADWNAGCYLPDFWLPQVSMWAEVKPDTFTEAEAKKCLALVEATGHGCLLLNGSPARRAYVAIECDAAAGAPIIRYALTARHLDEHRFYSTSPGDCVGHLRDIADGVTAARRAVFWEPR